MPQIPLLEVIFLPLWVTCTNTNVVDCYEEKAILFGRLHRHEQALGIYVMILQDPTGAEE